LQAGDAFEVQFRTASARFRLIDDSMFETLFVRYAESPALLGRLAKYGPERWIMRKLQRYTVNLSKAQFAKMHARGDIAPVYGNSFPALVSDSLYDESVGVLLDSDELSPNELVV